VTVLAHTAMCDAVARTRVAVAGEVTRLRIRPWAEDVATLECVVSDGSGRITLVFLGRPWVAGIGLGTRLEAVGMVIPVRGELAMLNPDYTITWSPAAHR
jgi:hypothetical protein